MVLRIQRTKKATIMAAALLLFPFLFFAGSSADSSSVYNVIQSYNFPIGLLPQGALRYDLDDITGAFSVDFNGSCSFSLEGSYQIRYQPSISGRISIDRLTDLHGVSVKLLLFWVNIVEVVRNGDNLQFSVGIASADFSVDNFYVCPQCGCGLDCGGASSNEEAVNLRLSVR